MKQQFNNPLVYSNYWDILNLKMYLFLEIANLYVYNIEFLEFY
jgi:hypothetical protein